MIWVEWNSISPFCRDSDPTLGWPQTFPNHFTWISRNQNSFWAYWNLYLCPCIFYRLTMSNFHSKWIHFTYHASYRIVPLIYFVFSSWEVNNSNRNKDRIDSRSRWNRGSRASFPRPLESILARIVRGYWPCSWPPSQLRRRVALFKDIEPRRRSMRSSTEGPLFLSSPLSFFLLPRSLLLRFPPVAPSERAGTELWYSPSINKAAQLSKYKRVVY